jgi:hypothetical protein
MTTSQSFGVVEASFVGGPADGTTAMIDFDPTGFPPVHVLLPDDDGVTRHLYSGLGCGRASLTVFRYLGPLSS